jgi:glycosyltransferase involved in cell wall biosynthesis
MPQEPGFQACGSVDQTRLPEYYAQGHVFALASREEGLATVQPQALACGLRLVCTDRTGGEDLAEQLPNPNVIRVVPSDNVSALKEALALALEDSRQDTGLRDHLGAAREHLSWKAYGERYSRNLLERL